LTTRGGPASFSDHEKGSYRNRETKLLALVDDPLTDTGRSPSGALRTAGPRQHASKSKPLKSRGPQVHGFFIDQASNVKF
jgi:hypothetical protein